MPSSSPSVPGRHEFILLISSIMMLVAFAIDSMLPALPFIGASFGVVVENDRQWVITAFMMGFGIAQLGVGTFSDTFGRRNLMLFSLFGYAVTSLAAAFAPTFEMLLVARMAQGFAAAGARVLVTSIVRDLFSGRAMAQVMSFAHVIFMAAPILAPLMGQGLLSVGPWQWIFGALCVLGGMVWFWAAVRLPETLAAEDRKPISWPQLRSSWGKVLADPQSRGYTLANAMLTGSTMSFLTSVQQIFDDIFDAPTLLPLGFGAMVIGMALAQLINSQLVMKLGMRRIGHAAIFFYTFIAIVHLITAQAGMETLWLFIGLQALMMAGFSFAAGNFGALSMENMGDVAGAASSLQGSFTSLIGMVIGAVVGQAFNGSTVPLTIGFVFCGTVSIISIFVTEGGRFFVPKNEPVRE